MTEPTKAELISAPIIAPPKPPAKEWPVLKHPKLKDFPLAVADLQIRQILTRLDKDPRPLHPQERAVITVELGTILGALMMYAEVQFLELEAIREAAETDKN